MKQNENFVTWAWDTRLFTHASMTVYCIGKSLLICNIVLRVARLGSTDMRWHRDKRVETNDVLRYPANVEGWKHFDSEYPDFASNPRNMCLGLASDGFNLFGQMSQVFKLYTALLWTINDFPAYGDLLGWTTKGYQAYPICMGDRSSFGIRGKTEDTANARLDLQDLKIRKDLHLVEVGIMSSSYPCNNFLETDVIFLEFEDDLDNIAEGSSSLGDNVGSSSQQLVTPTPRRRAQSRLLELERHVAINGPISITIAPGAKKPISPYIVHFSKAIDVFVEHQMLMTFKEFWADCHRRFKKYSNPKEDCANLPNVLVGRHEDWHFLCNHYMSRAFQAAEDAHRTAEDSQPLSEDEICDQVLGRRPGYSKGLRWGPKPKARKTMSASSSTMSFSQTQGVEWRIRALLGDIRLFGKKDVGRGIPDIGGFVAKNSIGRGIPDAVDVVEKHDVGRGIPDVVLFMRRKCLSRLRFPDSTLVSCIVSHRVDDHIEDDTLCKTNVDPTIVERSIVRIVIDDFINDVDEHLSHARDDDQL
ncbi:CACTA en-spm transposon protein [Cucumis melo var. makuwa]|uniref:CACTA en-spm transposon protein n=1 Tax=Cucumis melo var. makuwa TaxID=1194695 RepID=A0A5A7SSC5_CUCMM|nr:CACTA en-spm transposon protein [Cucumis melo var. makuwa]TYJ99895.1 CACTA en-spm transposon protein [Cucumis melo var. makuwa]